MPHKTIRFCCCTSCDAGQLTGGTEGAGLTWQRRRPGGNNERQLSLDDLWGEARDRPR